MPGMKSVATTATPIPSAAIWLPRRAEAGEPSSLSPMMKQTAEMRYAILMKTTMLSEFITCPPTWWLACA
jgi:hypothetical protein